jgi:hypothetical protein
MADSKRNSNSSLATFESRQPKMTENEWNVYRRPILLTLNISLIVSVFFKALLDATRRDSTRPDDATRRDSTRLDATRRDSTRLETIRRYSTLSNAPLRFATRRYSIKSMFSR